MAIDDAGIHLVGPIMDAASGVGITGLAALDPESLPPPPTGFSFGTHAFQVEAATAATGQSMTDLSAPLTVSIQLTQQEIAATGGDLSRAQLALRHDADWLGLGCLADQSSALLTCRAPATGQFAIVVAPPVEDVPDWPLPEGHMYKQANGFSGAGDLGYAVVDDGEASFWSEYQRYGGVEQLGYPISGRFMYGGYLTQAFQKLVLQWHPEDSSAVPVNVFDELHLHGSDAWLETDQQIPRPPASIVAAAAAIPADGDPSADSPLSLLDGYPELQQFYANQPDGLDFFGMPVAIADNGNVVSVRLQRATFQLWRLDTLWAAAGTIVVGNAGDLAKEAGLWPREATIPGPAAQE
jgi:hypothetical protein